MRFFQVCLAVTCCIYFILAKPVKNNLFYNVSPAKLSPYGLSDTNLRSINVFQRQQPRIFPFSFLSDIKSIRTKAKRLSSAEKNIRNLKGEVEDIENEIDDLEENIENIETIIKDLQFQLNNHTHDAGK